MLVTNTIITVAYADATCTKGAQAADWLRSMGWRRAEGDLDRDWDWDVHFLMDSAVFTFMDPRKAAQFKLTWGGV